MCRKCHTMGSTIWRPSSCWTAQKLLKTFSTVSSLGAQCKQILVGFVDIPSNSSILPKSRGGNPFVYISKSHLALCSSQPGCWTPAWQLLSSLFSSHFAFDPSISGWGLGGEASTGWESSWRATHGLGPSDTSWGPVPGQRTSNAQLQAEPIHCCTEEHRTQMQQINLNKSVLHSPFICPRNNSLSRAWATGKNSKASDMINNVYIQNPDVIFHPVALEIMACYFLLNQG